ncbi:MAG: serine/threonine-protein kinase, partial [archaeon]|nr:serine/threonine-protein kinase [archaeon]
DSSSIVGCESRSPKDNIYPVPYLEMELCNGSLGYRRRNVEEAVSIIYEVAKGLKHAHEKNIVHADIKHSNILIKDGKLKISDWGLSKVKRGKSLSVSALTPEFAVPEQILGRIDERTDIWQLGVVFYELVTGKLPFEGEYADVINHVLNDEPVAPSEINPDSKCVEHIIMKCLCKRKEERYQSVDELLKELEGYKPASGISYISAEYKNAETLEI